MPYIYYLLYLFYLVYFCTLYKASFVCITYAIHIYGGLSETYVTLHARDAFTIIVFSMHIYRPISHWKFCGTLSWNGINETHVSQIIKNQSLLCGVPGRWVPAPLATPPPPPPPPPLVPPLYVTLFCLRGQQHTCEGKLSWSPAHIERMGLLYKI